MNYYRIYYTKDLTAIYRGDARFDRETHDRVAECVEAQDLEDLFRKMNVVDGTELPVELKVRSMSVGDVAIDGKGVAWMCMIAGWERLHV